MQAALSRSSPCGVPGLEPAAYSLRSWMAVRTGAQRARRPPAATAPPLLGGPPAAAAACHAMPHSNTRQGMAGCSRAAHPLAKLLSKPELLSHGGARAGVGERLPALERAPRPARRVLVLERQPFLHTSNQRGRLLHCRAGVGRRWAAEGEAARGGRTAQVGGWQPAVPAARYRLSTARQVPAPRGKARRQGRSTGTPPVPSSRACHQPSPPIRSACPRSCALLSSSTHSPAH